LSKSALFRNSKKAEKEKGGEGMFRKGFWVLFFLFFVGLTVFPGSGQASEGIPVGGMAVRSSSGPELFLRAAARQSQPALAWKRIEMTPAAFGVSGVIVTPERLVPGIDSVTLGIRTPEGMVFRLFQLKWFAPMVVSKRDIRRKDTIRPEDLKVEIRVYRRSFGGNSQDPSCFFGKAAKRTIKAGEVITERDVEDRAIVERGDPVTLIARSGAVEAKIDGVALESGREKDVIRVRIPRYRRDSRGVVMGPNLVLILD
jgi:flagella basal body P-ring formation protein FlgA